MIREAAVTILERAARVLGGGTSKALVVNKQPASFGAGATLIGRNTPPPLGTAGLLLGYSKFPTLRMVVSKIAEVVSAIEFTLDARVGRQLNEIEEHPLLDLLDNPNPVMSRSEFYKIFTIYFCLVGESFWLIERNGAGLPIELWPIPPHWVRNIPEPGGEGFFEIVSHQVRANFPAADIVYIRDLDPMNPYARGSGTGRVLGDELETDEFAAKYVKSFFFNDARPDLLIMPAGDGEIKPEDAARLEQSWLQKLQGFNKTRKRPFFLSRRAEVKDLQRSLKDMDLSALRSFERDIIVHTYGMPPEILGILEASNRATIESAEHFLTRHVVSPKMEVIVSAIQRTLVPEFDKRLRVGFVSPVTEDKAHRLEVTKAHPFAFSVDELRADAELEPLADGQGEVHPLPFNILFGQPGTSQPASDDEERSVTISKAPNSSDIDRFLDLLNVVEFTGFNAATQAAVGAFGQQTMDAAGAGIDFDISDPVIDNFIRVQTGNRIASINATTRAQLRATLSEGIAAGDTISALSRRVSTVFTDATGPRLNAIARTESVRAANFGAVAGIKQAGLKSKEWLSSRDQNVRSDTASHVGLDGQIVDVDQVFTDPGDGATGQHPGGMSSAASSINCRCTTLGVINGKSLAGPEEKQRESVWKVREAERLPFERMFTEAVRLGFVEQERLIIADIRSA